MTKRLNEELSEEEQEAAFSEEELAAERRRRKRRMQLVGRILDRILLFVLTTLLMLSIFWLALEYVIVKGPSPTWKENFVLAMREDPRTGFVANIYLSQAEVEEIAAGAEGARDSWIPPFLEKTKPAQVDFD